MHSKTHHCEFCKAKRGARHPTKGFVVTLKAVNVNGLIKKGCQACYEIQHGKNEQNRAI